MMDNLSKILQARNETLRALKLHDGLEWKEAQGELHCQYKELPNWIFLSDNSDLANCHKIFTEIVAPYMELIKPFQFTVSYKLWSPDQKIILDFLADNDEITEALMNLNKLGISPTRQIRIK